MPSSVSSVSPSLNHHEEPTQSEGQFHIGFVPPTAIMPDHCIDMTHSLQGIESIRLPANLKLMVRADSPQAAALEAFTASIASWSCEQIICRNVHPLPFQGAIECMKLGILDTYTTAPNGRPQGWDARLIHLISDEQVRTGGFPLKARLSELSPYVGGLTDSAHWALNLKKLEVLKVVIELGAGAFAKNMDYGNALHVLCEKSETMTLDHFIQDLVWFLDKNVALLTEKNQDALTPLDLALIHHPHCGEHLLRHLVGLGTSSNPAEKRTSFLIQGVLAREGLLIQQNLAHAYSCFSQASRGGMSPQASYVLALAHSHGMGTPKDMRIAHHFLFDAAAQRFPPAMLDQAKVLLAEPDKYRYLPEIIDLLRGAADSCVPEAFYHMGLLAQQGHVNDAHDDGEDWFKDGANSSDPNAQFVYGQILLEQSEQSLKSFRPDVEKSNRLKNLGLTHLEYSHSQQTFQATQALAKMRFEGRYLTYNVDAGLDYYREFAQKSNDNALVYIANTVILQKLQTQPVSADVSAENVFRAMSNLDLSLSTQDRLKVQSSALTVLSLMPQDQPSIGLLGGFGVQRSREQLTQLASNTYPNHINTAPLSFNGAYLLMAIHQFNLQHFASNPDAMSFEAEELLVDCKQALFEREGMTVITDEGAVLSGLKRMLDAHLPLFASPFPDLSCANVLVDMWNYAHLPQETHLKEKLIDSLLRVLQQVGKQPTLSPLKMAEHISKTLDLLEF